MTAGSDWRASRSKRLQAAAIAAAVYPLVDVLGRSLTWTVEGMEAFDRVAASGRQPIMVFWHGWILSATWYFRRRGIVVITSENFDGEWIARVITRFGYGTARGSSSRGALKAMLQLKRELEQGKPVGFTLDGPRGPARQAQPGAVWLAKATGNPIVPFHVDAARSWRLGSWDRTQIPKPFSRMAIAVGEPIDVPGDLDEAGLESKRLDVERALAALEGRTAQILRKEPR